MGRHQNPEDIIPSYENAAGTSCEKVGITTPMPVQIGDDDQQLELTIQGNIPTEIKDSNGRNLDLTAESNVPVVLKDATGKELLLTDDIRVPVEIEYTKEISFDLFFYRIDATPVMSVNANVNDTTITVVSSVGVVAGDAITFYENGFIFQSIVTATTATTISFETGLDNAFTTAALIETGIYNAAVDGSVTPQSFVVKAPGSYLVHVHSLSTTILDTTDMDDGKFGGIPALTNGIVYRLTDGFEKQLALILNNIGFYQYGFETNYASKAPAGQYGFRARREISKINGNVLVIDGNDNGRFELTIRDDLTGLDEFINVAHGHIKD